MTESLINIHIDADEESGKTTGSVIFQFESHESAIYARENLHNLKLTPVITFTAYTFDEFDEILQTDDTFERPNYKTASELFYWINDSSLRDQFIVRSNNTMIPYWFNNIEKAVQSITKFQSGGVQSVKWSENGEYLLVFCANTVTVYGGETFDKITCFNHNKVKDAKVSPLGGYIVTCNGTAVEAGDSDNIIVWNFTSQKKLRSFQSEKPNIWASFQFSFDEKYLAGIKEHYNTDTENTENILCVFDPATMKLIEDPESKKPKVIQVANPQTVKWARKSQKLVVASYALGEDRQNKSEVNVIEIPSRRKYKWARFTIDIIDVNINWSLDDNYILLKLKTFGKKKIVNNLIQVGILDYKAQKVNVSTTDLDEFKFIQAIDVDNSVKKVTVFHKNAEKEVRLTMSIYQITGDHKNIMLKKILDINKIPDVPADLGFRYESITWSKVNNHFCLFDRKGNFRFGQMKEKHTREKGSKVESVKYEVELIGEPEFVGNKIGYANWDPSGRFMAILTEHDSRVHVYNIFGLKAMTIDEEKTNQFIWRPRKAFILTKKEDDDIKKNSKKMYEYYNEEDDKILNAKEHQERAKLQEKKEKFLKFMNLGKKRWDEMLDERVDALGWDEDVIEDGVNIEIIDNMQLIEETEKVTAA